jgi:hypothetical protein
MELRTLPDFFHVHETPILPKGTYQGSITIAGSGGAKSVTVPVWLYLS